MSSRKHTTVYGCKGTRKNGEGISVPVDKTCAKCELADNRERCQEFRQRGRITRLRRPKV